MRGGWGIVGAAIAGAACAAAPEPVAPRRTATPEGIALAEPAVTAYVGPPRATRMADALVAAGLDPANLPPLEKLGPGPRQKVMRTFTEALGVPCVGCHAEDDFLADTRRKRVAKRMWNEIVRVLATRDGEAVYCDSCHEGALFHLNRSDRREVASYMNLWMVGAMKRIDGRDHDCTTCHGEPPDFAILETWKKSPAPNLVSSVEGRKGLIVPVWPTVGPREPASCRADSAACPLEYVMRMSIAPAFAANDTEALVRVLSHVPRFAVEDLPRWKEITSIAIEAAKRGDREATKKACRDCHVEHMAKWRANWRTRGPQ
jgi:hypothetical protein